MSGKRPSKPAAQPKEPDPSPTPIQGRVEDEAKKKLRKKSGKGRDNTILAGRMNNRTLGNPRQTLG